VGGKPRIDALTTHNYQIRKIYLKSVNQNSKLTLLVLPNQLVVMLSKIKKNAFITLTGLFLLFGAGLDQCALESTIQSQQPTEESIETEIDQAIEIKRHTIRKARKHSVGFLSLPSFAESITRSAFAIRTSPFLQTNRYLLYRTLLI
jgi:hypothetical protein